VLFLDELPEFQRPVLDSLRQPLETGKVDVARANAHVTFPARVQLIAAMNPCRCGYAGDPARNCNKYPRCVGDYQARLSGPLLDRFDLAIEVPAVSASDLLLPPSAEGSAEVAARVASVSKYLERLKDAKGRPLHEPQQVALFLMRCLFTMFAEDTGLLPEKSFTQLLRELRTLQPQLRQRDGRAAVARADLEGVVPGDPVRRRGRCRRWRRWSSRRLVRPISSRHPRQSAVAPAPEQTHLRITDGRVLALPEPAYEAPHIVRVDRRDDAEPDFAVSVDKLLFCLPLE
jgi:hypothetical protein